MADIPKVEIARTYSNGVGFLEALQMAKEQGKTLLSNKEADVILQDDEATKQYVDLFYCRTGTVAIYTGDDRPFGKYLKGADAVVDIPDEFQGRKGWLVVEHPGYSIEEDGPYGLRILKAEKLTLLEGDFSEGWHLPDPIFGIPCGEKSSRNYPNARRLWRKIDEDSIVPLARYGGGFDGGRCVVDACRGFDYGLGVGFVEHEGREEKIAPKDTEEAKS